MNQPASDATKTKRKPPSLLKAILPLVLGVAVLGTAGYASFDSKRMRQLDETGIRVDAKVVGRRELTVAGSGSGRSKRYAAQIEFKTQDGVPVSGEARVSKDEYDALIRKSNATLTVVYLPDAPQDFQPQQSNRKDAEDARDVSFLFFVIGAVLLLFGLFETFRYRRQTQAAS